MKKILFIIILLSLAGCGKKTSSVAVNAAPIMSAPSNIIAAVNSAKTLTLSASDAEGSSLTYSATSSTANVTVGLSGATLTLTPATDWTGTATITVKANDGTVDSSSKTFTLTVGANTPLLVVRIAFTDTTFVSSEATWASKIFGTGDGQINHYMSEVSDGSFQFVAANETGGTANDGIVTATLSVVHPKPESAQMLSEQRAALTLIVNKVDFAAYDTNSNGYISSSELLILYIVAGQSSLVGAHASGDSSWPSYDSVRVGNYARFGERHSVNHDATIGVIAHELMHHRWGVRDLYDQDFSSAGIGWLGMMGSGSNARKSGEEYGETPVHPTGFSKIKMGFISPTVISADGTYTAYDINSASNNVFKVESGTSNEYFLIENRNYVGYDKALNSLSGSGTFAGGLLITHIDENVTNNLNDSQRLVDIEEANDAMLDSRCCGHKNNFFFNGNSGTFNNSSTPNSKKNDGTASNISITSIGAQGPAMSFTIDIP
jgi:M6 family metalloprotease-like protein